VNKCSCDSLSTPQHPSHRRARSSASQVQARRFCLVAADHPLVSAVNVANIEHLHESNSDRLFASCPHARLPSPSLLQISENSSKLQMGDISMVICQYFERFVFAVGVNCLPRLTVCVFWMPADARRSSQDWSGPLQE
jgi:hypothetical protein